MVQFCNYPGCGEIKGNNMRRITFGVHPDVVRTLPSPVAVISQCYFFCPAHAPFYQDSLYATIARHLCGKEMVIGDAGVREGLGCFITISILSGISGNDYHQNLQMPYVLFARVFSKFPQTFSPQDTLLVEQMEKLRRL